MSNFARIRSDYSTETCMVITRNDDGDVSVRIYGDDEMRIATSGSRLHGEHLGRVLEAFQTLIDVINEEAKQF